MSEDPLTLESIQVHKAPGFDQGGFDIEDIGPGVNIVHGPNASGKTTIANAIQSVLWPKKAPKTAHLTAHFNLQDDAWRVNVEACRATYQRNGQDVERPGLPSSDQRDRYALALHDLLQDETRDGAFADQIIREMQGGYDLSKAADELGYDATRVTRGRNVVKDADNALNAYREAKQETRSLLDEERRLPQLRRKLAEIKDAQNKATLLKDALDHAKARQRHDAARKHLDTFPRALERIDGTEIETVRDLEGRIEDWEDRREDAEKKRRTAEKSLEEANLPETPPDGFLEKLASIKDEIEKKETKLDDARTNLDGAKRKRSTAINDIPADVQDDDLEPLEEVGWNQLQRFVQKANTILREQATKEAVERRLANHEPPDEEAPLLRQGRDLLDNWLAAPRSLGDDQPRSRRSILLLGALAAASALLLVILAWSTVGPVIAGILLVVLLVMAGGLVAHGLQGGRDSLAEHQAYRNRFTELPLKPPTEWRRDAVRSRYDELQQALADHRVHRTQQEVLETLREQTADIDEEVQELEEEREALIERFGLAPDTSHLDLYATANGIARWQKAHAEVCRLEEEIQTLEEQRESTLEELNEALDSYGYEPVTRASQAKETIRNLETRVHKHKDAERTREEAQATLTEALDQIEALESKRDAVFESAGLKPGERDRLRDLCDEAPAYEEAKRKVEDANVLVTNALEALEAAGDDASEFKEASIATIEQAQRDVEETTSQYDETFKEINRIENEVEAAKRGRTVEEALTVKERALDALEEELGSDYASRVGDVLTDHVQEATSGANRPKVLEKASNILSKITKERYALEVDAEDTTFRAYDTVKQRGFGLDALSSGTRVQVLLAVRIAFVEQHERGTRLPLILDEALANTDDARADAIIDAVLELARDGRQIFYFTAQGDEVAKWRIRLQETPDIEHAIHNLAPVQDLGDHVHVPDLSKVHVRTPTPPDPSGHTHASYGDEVGVEPMNPRQGAGRTHIWYVVDDVDLMHALLEIGIERWGQLRRMMERGSEHLVTDDAERVARLERRGHALEAFIDAWRRGRGRLVTREALEESGAVSDTFIDEVASLAKRVNGDGARIIEALRAGGVKGFRSGKMDELESYLVENGYIDAVDPLSPEEVRMSMLKRVSVMDAASNVLAGDVDAVLERIQSRGAVAKEVASS